VVVVSASSDEIGCVVHANEEIENVLGYKRKELIGRNVGIIMPKPIAESHNEFIRNYFEKAKSAVVDK
jgi:PAS domain S-box-containing protein